MPYISKTKIIPFSYKELFDLVMDVESYVDFLPFCSEAKITSKTEAQIEADLKISFAGVSESYSSLIIPTFNDEYASIDVKATKGPFKYLTNIWKFIKLDEAETVIPAESGIHKTKDIFIMDPRMRGDDKGGREDDNGMREDDKGGREDDNGMREDDVCTEQGNMKRRMTRVEFSLDFELKSFLLSKIIDVFLKEMNHKILDAFEKRAREKYDVQNLSK